MVVNTKTDWIAEKIYEYLLTHPKSTRIQIEMGLEITFRKFEECRDILGPRIVSEKNKKVYYFSAVILPHLEVRQVEKDAR